MSKLSALSYWNPVVLEIARLLPKRSKLPFDILVSEEPIVETARERLQGDEFLQHGASILQVVPASFFDYIFQITLARRMLKREEDGTQIQELKMLLKYLLPKGGMKETVRSEERAFSEIWNIKESLMGVVNEGINRQDDNFVNFCIETLNDIKNTRENEFESSLFVSHPASINMKKLYFELMSGDHGFYLNSRQANLVCDILDDAQNHILS